MAFDHSQQVYFLPHDPATMTGAGAAVITCSDSFRATSVTRTSMSFGATLPIVIGLFIAMVICLEAGYRLARRRIRISGDAHEGLGSIEAAVFAILGLLWGSRSRRRSRDSTTAVT